MSRAVAWSGVCDAGGMASAPLSQPASAPYARGRNLTPKSLEPDALARSLGAAERPRREAGVVGRPLADGTQRIGPSSAALPQLWDGSADLDEELKPIAAQNKFGVTLFFVLCATLVAGIAVFGIVTAWTN